VGRENVQRSRESSEFLDALKREREGGKGGKSRDSSEVKTSRIYALRITQGSGRDLRGINPRQKKKKPELMEEGRCTRKERGKALNCNLQSGEKRDQLQYIELS